MGNCCEANGEEAVDRRKKYLISQCVSTTMKGAMYAGESYTPYNESELKSKLQWYSEEELKAELKSLKERLKKEKEKHY